jgi:AraC-like DNA-binding protein
MFALQARMGSFMQATRKRLIQSLFDNYIAMYAARDERLIAFFSENFSGYTGGGDFLVTDRAEWVTITLQDFAQVPGHIRIEMLDLVMQDLCADVVAATALFHIHLPVAESVLSKESARLSLVFRCENGEWKITHSGISVPDFLVGQGEVYPIKRLYERNQNLEMLLQQRTRALRDAEKKLARWGVTQDVRQCLGDRLNKESSIQSIAQALNLSVRTLGRQLADEGTTFLKIKDELRRKIALRLLKDSALSVETISAEIGFTSLTAFYRAFKTWTGGTPRSYRLAHTP